MHPSLSRDAERVLRLLTLDPLEPFLAAADTVDGAPYFAGQIPRPMRELLDKGILRPHVSGLTAVLTTLGARRLLDLLVADDLAVPCACGHPRAEHGGPGNHCLAQDPERRHQGHAPGPVGRIMEHTAGGFVPVCSCRSFTAAAPVWRFSGDAPTEPPPPAPPTEPAPPLPYTPTLAELGDDRRNLVGHVIGGVRCEQCGQTVARTRRPGRHLAPHKCPHGQECIQGDPAGVARIRFCPKCFSAGIVAEAAAAPPTPPRRAASITCLCGHRAGAHELVGSETAGREVVRCTAKVEGGGACPCVDNLSLEAFASAKGGAR